MASPAEQPIAPVPPLAAADPARPARYGWREHGSILVLLALFLTLAWATVDDYGITLDCSEYYLGDKFFHFFISGDPGFLVPPLNDVPEYRLPGHPNFHAFSLHAIRYPHHVWPLGPMATSATKWLLFSKLHLLRDPFTAHHAALPLFAAALAVALYYFLLAEAGFWPAVIAVVATLSYPRYWADLHFNVKDGPSATLYVLVLLSFYWGLMRRQPRWLLASAVAWGLALATKANAFFLPITLGPWFLYVLYRRRQRREPLLERDTVVVLLAYPFIGVAVWLLAWPYLLLEAPAAEYAYLPQKLYYYLHDLAWRGAQGDPHWKLHSLRMAIITMPPLVLLLLAGGLALVAWRSWRARALSEFDLLLLLWLTIPILRVSTPRAMDFDGIRHFLEFVPAAAALAGIAAGHLLLALARDGGWRQRLRPVWLWRCDWGRGLLVLLAFSPVLAWNVRNHPHQIAYFNCLTGGLQGAQARGIPEATDYWGVSYKQACRWLNAHADHNAAVVVGVGDTTLSMPASVWLRPDIRVLESSPPYVEATPEQRDRRLGQVISAHPGAVYLVYITRKPWYSALVQRCDGVIPPSYEIRVDGGVILRILQLR